MLTEAANLRWKEKLASTATQAVRRLPQLADIIYGKLRDRQGTSLFDDDVDQLDSSKFVPGEKELRAVDGEVFPNQLFNCCCNIIYS